METKELIEQLKSCAEKNCAVCPDIEECVGPAWLLKKAAERIDGWVAVDKCVPTMVSKGDYLESDYVLVWDGVKVEIAQAVSDESGVYWLDRCADVVTAVSWMPIPTPPEK